MQIVVAPDSFKGSLDATEFCQLATRVIELTLPDTEVISLPMADGGEGLVSAMVNGAGGKEVALEVRGPMGTNVLARYGLLEDGKVAVVEMAQASGLPLVEKDQRNPLAATSYGTGQLIRHALEQGVTEIIIGLGGSATNDAGVGALQALGFRFYTESGEEVEPGGGGLCKLTGIDSSGAMAELKQANILLASDVTNPLLGPKGATRVYGRQKGADEDMMVALERGLSTLNSVVTDHFGQNFSEIPGAGAAGGMGFGFLACTGAKIRSGFDVVADTYGLKSILKNKEVKLVITGEGAVDGQSVQGKLIGRLAELAKVNNIPVIVFAGGVIGDVSGLYELGVTCMSSIVTGPMSLEQAMLESADLLEKKLLDFCMLYKAIG